MRISLRVKTCCCGANLRTGTLIIGTLDFIAALVTVIITSIAAYNSYPYYDFWDGYRYDPMNDLNGMYTTMAVLNSVLMVFDIMLLSGVSRANPRLIRPWIFYSFVSLLSNFICAMVYGIYSLTYAYDSYGYLSISWSILYLVLKLYFLLVVWSLYQEMQDCVGTVHNNGVHVTMYPPVPIGQQPCPHDPQTYPNVQMQYPNGQQPYPNVQQPYPNVQQQYPNVQQPYPNIQQPYPNVQQSYPNIQVQQSYPNAQDPYLNPQPLPSMQNMNRNL